MNMCPHCGGVALSFWKKMFLGPTFKVPCAQCRNLVGIAKPWLSLAPILILSLAPILIDAWMPFKFIAAIPVIALYWWWVPMEKRGPTLDREGVPVQPRTAPAPQ